MSLEHALAHAGHLLPAQAPLEVFVHHNTLHAFQHLPFHQAVAAANAKLGARSYLPEARYRQAFTDGRITLRDIDQALQKGRGAGLPTMSPALPTAVELARSFLIHGIEPESAAGLRWRVFEHRADVRFAPGVSVVARQAIERDSREGAEGALAALWERCREICAPHLDRDAAPAADLRFARDVLLAVGGDDPDDLVHPFLIPLAAAFLDRGHSHWSMPDREGGFFIAVRRVLGAGHAVRPHWLTRLGARLRRWNAEDADAERVVAALIEEMGVEPDAREAFIERTLLLLPGWAGMFHKLETAPGPTGRAPTRVRLVDFLAVRLCLDLFALEECGRRLGYDGPVRALRGWCAARPAFEPRDPVGDHGLAWPLFLLAQHAGLSASALGRLGDDDRAALVHLVKALDEPTRTRLWHEAYELHYREELLGALATSHKEPARASSPSLQAIFCLDDREESIRRHFEELDDTHATFGTAGFFNLAIAYQGIDDPATFPLCPVVVSPQHRIEEEPHAEYARVAAARRRWLRRYGTASARFARASRSIVWGPLLTAATGFLAALPLLASVFAPGLTGRLQRAVRSWLLPEPRTRLTLPRSGDAAVAGLLQGFALDEKVARVGALLENIGLVSGFARLVAVLGHDSASVNNPHFAAYSCGACGGRSGGPNARLFARMANRPEVRERLRERGIDIPDDTWFVGGVHDSCVDAVDLFDVDDVPGRFASDLGHLREALARACERNAHERSRRFESAPRGMSAVEARRHVEARSLDLSQARPELGHATNAGCVVGRRALTYGLFLDRRVFLASYDPTVDPRGEVLERTLLAVGPVCAGINLEYYFSTTDNERYGAGTKLPHNVTGLFGVMNGASSDLRTGLPRQMIEIHEPVRLQLVVEARVETVRAILDRAPRVRELVTNEWVRLSLLDPDDGRAWTFDPARGFELWSGVVPDLPRVRWSSDWYADKIGFVPPARIDRRMIPEVYRAL